MTSSAIAWLILSSYFGSGATETEESTKKERNGDRPIKAEEEETTESDFDSPHAPSAGSKQEAEKIKQEEDSEDPEDPSGADPQAAEAGNEDDEDDERQQIRENPGVGTDSGIGTSLESASVRGVQRRRSRLFGGHGDGH